MPVQFTCSHCHRRLSVAHRKAGTTVACPKCGQPNVVPGSTLSAPGGPPAATIASAACEVLAAAPPARSTPSEPSDDAQAQQEGYRVPVDRQSPQQPAAAFEEVLQLITDHDSGHPAAASLAQPPAAAAAPPMVSVAVASAAPSSAGAPPVVGAPLPAVPPPIPPIVESRLTPTTALAARGPATRRGRHDDGAVLVLSRKAVFAQAALAGGFALLAFLAGLTIGRSGRPIDRVEGGSQAAADPVPLDGHVVYSISPGNSMPDAGAIIIAVPAGKAPPRKLASRGLHPGDDGDFSALPAVDELRALGGAVARADESGQFQLVVPRPGDFHILIVSHRAKRPYDQTISLADQEELSRVFASPSDLIGQQQYAILSRRLAGVPQPYTHEFRSTKKS